VTADLRPAADRCPGLLRPHRAEDGLVVRIRLPGGRIGSDVLLALTGLGGTLQLTSRANVQLRGIAETELPELTEQVAALGLLPSATHELVRNVVASPLTGLATGRPDFRPMISGLDAAVCDTPDLAELPGRFLFAIDDGSGDVWSLDFDVGYLARNDAEGFLAVGSDQASRRRGALIRREDAVAEMVQIAADFVQARRQSPGVAWRIWDLDDSSTPHPVRPLRTLGGRCEVGLEGAESQGRVAGDFDESHLELRTLPSTVPAARSDPRTPLGILGRAICAGVPLGFLTSSQAAAIATAAAGGPVVITPWRSMVIPDAADSLPMLAAAGLVIDPASPWSMITACVGSPGCAKSLIDTRAVAADLAGDRPSRLVHVSGCGRRCGAPAIAHDELVGRR
jgi:precorrin-3B synthase